MPITDTIRQLSTHLDNEKKGKDERLDELLIQWGEWRRYQAGLGVAPTSLASAIDIQKAHKQEALKPGCQIIYGKQTRVTRTVIPPYWVHKRMSKINNAVWELKAKHQEMLIKHYEDNWKGKEFTKEYSWKLETYHEYMSRARRAIRNHITIKEMLGRS